MEHLQQRLQPLLPTTRREALLLTGATAVLGAASAAGLAWCVRDYRTYMSMGPGGPPHNVFGWAAVTLLVRPFSLGRSGALSTADYPPAAGAHEGVRSLPERRGERPTLVGVAPHRQLTQRAPEGMREHVRDLFDGALAANGELLEKKQSYYEVRHDGYFVRQSVLSPEPPAAAGSGTTSSSGGAPPAIARKSQGEIGHPHEDLSVHLYVSPADARVLIEKGWAERHRLALPRSSWVRPFGVGDTYLMLYGPRDEAEMEVLKVALLNSIRFMTGREDVADFDWRVQAKA